MFRMNGIARWQGRQGRQGAHMFRMNGIAQWQGRQGAHMFRMNGQGFCSKHALSTYIHVSNSAMARTPKRAYVQGWTVFWIRRERLNDIPKDKRSQSPLVCPLIRMCDKLGEYQLDPPLLSTWHMMLSFMYYFY